MTETERKTQAVADPHPGMACYRYEKASCGCPLFECLSCSVKDGTTIKAEPLYSNQRAESHRSLGHDVREVKP